MSEMLSMSSPSRVELAVSVRTHVLPFYPPLLYKVVRYYRSPHISTAHPQYLKPAHAPGEACDGAKTTIKPPLKWTRAVRKSFPFTHGGHRAGSACRTPLIVNQGEREREREVDTVSLSTHARPADSGSSVKSYSAIFKYLTGTSLPTGCLNSTKCSTNCCF